MRTTPSKDKAIRIRLSQGDKDALFMGATIAGLSVSDFIRSNALAAANRMQTECKQE
jgi:uncharacterized protein (DUF1778 family)